MKRGELSHADNRPQSLEFRKLFEHGNTYELTANDNIEEGVAHAHAPETEECEARTEFTYTTRRDIADIHSYDEAVAAFIALKYSFADEFSLMRKGQADKENAEYTEYISFVEACKAFCREHFREGEK